MAPSFTPKHLATGLITALNTANPTTIYTTPGTTNLVTIVTDVLVCNTSGAPVKVRLYAILSGQTATAGQATGALLFDYAISPNDSVALPTRAILANGDFLAISASTASVVQFWISGAEEVTA